MYVLKFTAIADKDDPSKNVNMSDAFQPNRMVEDSDATFESNPDYAGGQRQDWGIINATGPWADRLPHSKIRIRPTKGVHIVVDRDRMPVPDAVIMIDGKRILFAIPWGERTYLGTSDTDFHGPLDRPVCTGGSEHVRIRAPLPSR